MANKIEIVKAFKYNNMLFATKKEVDNHVVEQKAHKQFLAEIDNKKKLDNPISFTMKNSYFDFLVFSSGHTYGEDYKRVCYKRASFVSALDSVIKRMDCTMLDYECEILDKNKMSTGVFIDLHKMPESHIVHQYL